VPIRTSELLRTEHRVNQIDEGCHAERKGQNRHNGLHAIAELDEPDQCDECHESERHHAEREQHIDLLPGAPLVAEPPHPAHERRVLAVPRVGTSQPSGEECFVRPIATEFGAHEEPIREPVFGVSVVSWRSCSSSASLASRVPVKSRAGMWMT
jgi:hypothetical protein